MKKEIVNLSIRIGRQSIDLSKLDLCIAIMEQNKMTIDHRMVNKYVTVSISGRLKLKHGGASFGQVDSSLREDGLTRRATDEDTLAKILDYWDEYHLNDCKAGCIHQGSVNANVLYDDWKVKSAEETAKCPHHYSYGSQWLLKEIPWIDCKELIELFGSNIEKYPELVSFYLVKFEEEKAQML